MRKSSLYKYAANEALIEALDAKVKSLRSRIAAQDRSYDTLQHLVQTKEEMLAAIPAIQPVSNKDLSQIASGFGFRIDPIYKMPKMHTGLDFAAAIGTPVYATANGVVGLQALRKRATATTSSSITAMATKRCTVTWCASRCGPANE